MRHIVFADVYGQIQRYIQNTDTSVLTIIKEVINNEYHKLLLEKPWDEMIQPDGKTWQLTSGQNYLAFRPDIRAIIQISDLDNDYVFQKKTLRQTIGDNLQLYSTKSRLIYYSELGFRPIRQTLSGATSLRVTAENSADTSIEVRIRGMRSDVAIPQTESITTDGEDGTTPVNGTVSFGSQWGIDSIGTNTAPANGYIQIQENNAGAATIAYIPKGEKQSLYYILHFENPPATNVQIHVIAKKRPPQLVDDDDPLVVPDLAPALVQKVLSEMRRYDRQYDQALAHAAESRGHINAVLNERELQADRRYQVRPDFTGRGLWRVS